MKKVTALVRGGLGNQMFIYAAARRLAYANEAQLVLDDYSGFARDWKYKRDYQLGAFPIKGRKANYLERLEPFARLQRRVRRLIARCLPFYARRYVFEEFRGYDYRLTDLKLSGSVYLDGYWQSYKYFEDINESIKVELTPPGPQLSDRFNNEMSRRLTSCNSVCVHVRFFDDPAITDAKNNVSLQYYRSAIAYIEEQLESKHYFIFSERPAEAASLLGLKAGSFTIVDGNSSADGALLDLWLMHQCRHHIIANSTFSWWAAWLGSSNDQIVVSPGWLSGDETAWGFEGLLPESWHVIDAK